MDRKSEKTVSKAPAAGDRTELLKRALLKIESLEKRLATAERVKNEPVAIVGMGCRLPAGANDPQAFWQLLTDGVDAMSDPPLSRWNVDDYFDPDPEAIGKAYTMMGGFIEDVEEFDAAFFGISPREAEQMDPQQRWLLQVSWHALEDAGIAPEQLFGSQTGVFVGMTGSDFLFLQTGNDSRNIDTYLASGTSHAIAAGRLSYALGLRGPAMTIDTACSSALLAVHLACSSLRLGECDTAVAGGVLLILSPDGYVSACKAQLLSPDGHCKTFDDAADGYARAEGCAMVTLKRLSDAERDGDKVLAVIRGSAANQDGRSGGLTAPNGNAQEAVIKEALANAGIASTDVSYVETHGTGTALGDPIEVQALASVYSEQRSEEQPLVIGSVKSNIGHTEGLAGLAGLIKLVLSLQNERIPGDLHFNRPNSHIPWEDMPLVVADKLLDWPKWAERKIGGLSSFGFSGTNVHMLVEQAQSVDAERSQIERPLHLLTLSARREEALEELAKRFAERLEDDSDESLADICYTANTGRNHFEYRAAVSGATRQDLATGLREFARDEQGSAVRGDKVQPHVPQNVAFVFAGEGAQHVGMGRDLFDTQPAFRKILLGCDRLLQDQLQPSLLSVLYPEKGDDTRALLDEPRYAQPATFAFAWGLVEMWEAFGVTPAAVMGFGSGEIAAACAAGIIDFEQGLMLAAERGRQFEERSQAGAMTAVSAGEDRVRQLIADIDDAAVAAVNASDSVVISGTPNAVRVATEKLAEKGIETHTVASSLPLQTSRMDAAAKSIAEAASAVRHGVAHIDFVSTLTGKLAAGKDAPAASYWGEQITRESRFLDATRTLRSRGCRACVEIGPRGSLLAMTRRSLPGQSLRWLPALGPDRDDWQQVLACLATFYVEGLDIDWRGFDSGYARRKVSLPTYPFERQVYEIRTARPSWEVEDVDAYLHPLVGKRLHSPRIADWIWESRLDAESAIAADHSYFNCPVVAAGAFIEAALTAGTEALDGQPFTLREFHHTDALAIGEGVTVQTVVSAPDGGSCVAETFGLPGGRVTHWTKHSSCRLEPVGERGGAAANPEVRATWEDRCRENMIGLQLYEMLADNGINSGPTYRVLESLGRRDGEAVARIRVTASGSLTRLPMGLTEACSHILQVALPGMVTLRPGAPMSVMTSVDTIWIDADIPDSLFAHAMADENGVGDVHLYDNDGKIVGEMTGIRHGVVNMDAVPGADRRRLANWLYGIDWEPKKAAPMNPAAAQHWLLLADGGGFADQVSKALEKRGEKVSIVAPDNAADPRDVLAAALAERPDTSLSILYLRSLDSDSLTTGTGAPSATIAAECHRLLDVARAATQLESKAQVSFAVVTCGAQAVRDDAGEHMLAQAPFVGIQRVLSNEHPELSMRIIDVDPRSELEASVLHLCAELGAIGDEDRQVAYRNGKRYVARLARCDSGDVIDMDARLDLESGAYLVTGGLGGIGLTVADWLVRRGARHLFLMGRSGASENAQKRIAEFEAAGADVRILNADVGDVAEMRSAFDTIDKAGVPLRGVFHAAGVIDDALLQNQDLDRVAKVMRPKVDGTWSLHTLTSDRDLDYFVLFSAAAAVFGNPGQSNYAAANLFLDGLAHYRRKQGLPALSINWGAWAEVGMAASLGSAAHDRWAQLGVGDIAPRDGAHAMELAILTGQPQLAVMPINWVQWRRAFPGGKLPPFTSRLMQATNADAAMAGPSLSNLRELLASADEERGIHLGGYVTRQLSALLGLVPEEIDIKQPVSELGFDSLMATNLKTRIEADLSIDIPVAALLDGPNTRDLVDRLLAVFDQGSTSAVASTEKDDGEWEEGAL